MRLLLIFLASFWLLSLGIIHLSAKGRFIEFPYSLVEGDRNPIHVLLQVQAVPLVPSTQNQLKVQSQNQNDSNDIEKLQLKILNEILNTRNDNDPRLDTEFKQLSAKTKQALVSKYSELKTEDRNGRGLIVFILGKNISSNSDLEFFNKVLTESPCLSLTDCNQISKQATQHDPAQAVTLVYPQMVALESIKNYLLKNAGSRDAIHLLKKAQKSKNPMITESVTRILVELQNRQDQV